MSGIEVGQILKIKKISGEHLVIEAGVVVDSDRLRYENYAVFQFKTVKILPSGETLNARKWWLIGSSMSGVGSPVELDGYQIVGTASFKTETTYLISKIQRV